MSDPAIAGSALGSGPDRASKNFGKNRTCDEPGCETLLSRYNPGKFCSLHEPMSVPRTRGRKIDAA